MERQAAYRQPDGYLISLEDGKALKLPSGMTHPAYLMANTDKYQIPPDADPNNDGEFMERALRENNLIRSRHFIAPYGGTAHGYEFPSDDPRAFQIAQKHYLSKYARDKAGRVSLHAGGRYINVEDPLEDWYEVYRRHKK